MLAVIQCVTDVCHEVCGCLEAFRSNADFLTDRIENRKRI